MAKIGVEVDSKPVKELSLTDRTHYMGSDRSNTPRILPLRDLDMHMQEHST